MEHTTKIVSIEQITHDVKRFRVEKPDGYSFTPGQATAVSIVKENWKDEKRPFTFTSLNEDDYLEFIIKIYKDHEGVTAQLDKLVVGDQLEIGPAWGAISYQGEGYFLAGGAGITPFIAIFRDLAKKNKLKGNKLIFGNKEEKDIILKNELEEYLGNNCIHVLSDEKKDSYYHGFIDEELLKKEVDDFSKEFYICGPEPMMDKLQETLKKLGTDTSKVVF